MSYHDLSECTLSDTERLLEIKEIHEILKKADVLDNLTTSEAKFVNYIPRMNYCSVKQLFWARDIKDKYL